MEFKKIVNFLNTNYDENLSRFITKKWVEIYDQSVGNYNVNKKIRIKTSMLRSDLCDYSDAYIVVKGDIIVTKKIFTVADFERPHNTNINATNTNNANNNAFGEKKKRFLKIMHHLLTVSQKLMA